MSDTIALAIAIVTSVCSLAAAGYAATLTRRSSKESTAAARDSNAVTGYASLVDDLRTEVDQLKNEVRGWRRGARQHREWDDLARAALRRLGEDMPPPPPIDPLEAEA